METIPDDGAALLHEHLFIDSRGRYPVPNGMAQPVALDAAPLTFETLAAARRTLWAFASQVLQLDSVDAAIHELTAQQKCYSSSALRASLAARLPAAHRARALNGYVSSVFFTVQKDRSASIDRSCARCRNGRCNRCSPSNSAHHYES